MVKKYIFTFFIFLLTLFCIIFPEDMITAAKTGLTLWWQIILPSLFPFMILSNLIVKTALPQLFSKFLSPPMQFIFRLPGISAIALFLGLVGGYPIGAKVTADLRNNNAISKEVANSLIKFTNNSGPLFITGAIGLGLYNNKKIGILLLLTHYISAILVGFLLRPSKVETNTNIDINFDIVSLSKLGSTLSNAIKDAIISIVIVGGFIVLFSIVLTVLLNSGFIAFLSSFIFPGIDKNVTYSIISGLLEVTNGINILSTTALPLKEKLMLTSILVGFGGFSIHAQTLSVIAKTDIKISSYLIGKILHGIIAGALTYLALIYTNFSEILITPVFNGIEYNSYGFNMIFSVITGIFIFVILFKIFQILLTSK